MEEAKSAPLMLQVLNPTYSLRVVIKDELPTPVMMDQMTSMQSPYSRKWYDPLAGKTGCDDVLSAVKEALAKAGLQAEISFVSFEHR